jgi:restriction endonuclease Mrr
MECLNAAAAEQREERARLVEHEGFTYKEDWNPQGRIYRCRTCATRTVHMWQGFCRYCFEQKLRQDPSFRPNGAQPIHEPLPPQPTLEERERALRERERAVEERERKIAQQERPANPQHHLHTVGGWRTLSPTEFEHECAQLLTALGYAHVTVTKASGDGGIDLVATKAEARYAGQCKRYTGVIDVNDVRAFAGVVRIGGFAGGLFLTTGGITDATRKFAEEAHIHLIDGPRLVTMAKIAYP